jgi:hypothetical protein
VSELADGFTFYRSRLELRRSAHSGVDVLILSGSTKYSPLVSVSFYFGRSFDQVREVEKDLGELGLPYHIQQYSPNLSHMKGIRYSGPHTWEVDLRQPPRDLAKKLAVAVRAMAYPFFDRFRELRAARDAVASRDPWCFDATGPYWRSLFLLDAALDDLLHFKEWMASLDPFYVPRAAEMLAKFERVGRRDRAGAG